MIAALYVEDGGSYFGLHGVDPWPEARDARNYAGPHSVVAHPPCQRWGKLWAGQPLHIKRTGERKRKGDDNGCFAAALVSVRAWGGVLEHPWGSHAWPHFGLQVPPRVGGWVEADDRGGWTCCVEQGRYGHYARKPTLLLAYGTERPELDWGVGEPRLDPAVIERMGLKRAKRLGEVGARGGGKDSAPRIGTPAPFRELLLDLARSAVLPGETHTPRLTGSKRSGNKLPVLSTENEMSKFTLTIEVNSLEELAKLTVALKGATVAVTGGGAATPSPTLGSAPMQVGNALTAAAAPQAAPAQAPAPTTATSPSSAALDFKTDVLGAYGAALKTKKAEGVTAINAQFGINGPLAIKDKPELWPAYIAALNA